MILKNKILIIFLCFNLFTCCEDKPEHIHHFKEISRSCWCINWICEIKEKCSCGEVIQFTTEYNGQCSIE